MNDDLHRIVGTNGKVVGFGLNQEYEVSETLQEATLTVVDYLDCVLNDRLTFGSILTRNMFCAGAKNNVSACNGDSGGGMFFNIDGTWYLRGIVSTIPSREHGARLVCDTSKYTIFTDVSKYREWILRYTNTAKWLKELKPCQDRVIAEGIMCNAASRHDHGFLLISMSTGNLSRVSLSDGKYVTSTRIIHAPKQVKIDCAEGHMFIIEAERHIVRMNYDMTDQKIVIKDAGLLVLSLAVDWVSRRLYRSSYVQDSIEVALLDNPDVRTVLISNAVAWHMTVDPHQGKLYWTDSYTIEWSNLDGSERQVLIENLEFVHKITNSISTGELCYAVGLLDARKIECIDTRTKRIQTVLSQAYIPTIAVTEKLLYWTERHTLKDKNYTIESIDHFGVRRTMINLNKTIVGAVAAVTDICPMFHSQCAINNGGCPENTICLLSPRDPLGKTCKQLVKSDASE